MIANKTTSLQLPAAGLSHLIDEVLTSTYPSLFETLSELTAALALLSAENSNHELSIISQKIFLELDTMHRKEKFVLFPYIKKLSAENKKTGTCAPFKNLKLHVTAILTLLVTIKRNVSNSYKTNTCTGLIKDFESKLTGMQKAKEKNIFSPVRSCDGCKVIH